MNLLRRLSLAGTAAILAVAMCASFASAFSLRSPQVTFSSSSLQGYFTSISEPINVNTQQVDAQTWSTTVAGNSDFTILLKNNPLNSSIGVYNSNDPSGTPTLFQVFPGAAGVGWSAMCHFGGGQLIVSLFNNGVFQGSTVYPGVDANHFSFYMQNANGTFYSQDGRNAASAPQVLTYAGVRNYGDWFECFESDVYNSSTSTFTGAVLDLQSVLPTPTRAQTWGDLKARYR